MPIFRSRGSAKAVGSPQAVTSPGLPVAAEDDWATADAALQRSAALRRPPAEKEGKGSAVGVLLLLAYGAFVITYAIAGQRAAGIAFWIVALGVPSLYVLFAALGAAWNGSRDDELLKVATLAIELAEQRRAESVGSESDAAAEPSRPPPPPRRARAGTSVSSPIVGEQREWS